MGNKFLFGPVPSRRLGLSMGINIVPYKVCSYNCIYCEVGRTTKLSIKRESFFNIKDIKEDFIKTMQVVKNIDYVTFSGSGEPTLNRDIGRLIDFVKTYNDFKVAVLTNGSLMFLDDVKNDLMNADVVIPSLDTASEETFRRINMPHHKLNLEEIIKSLAIFSNAFKGELWLEILFVKGLNDSLGDLNALVDAIKYINPTKVQMGTIERPPAYKYAKAMSNDEMFKIREYFMERLNIHIDIINYFNKIGNKLCGDIENFIIKMISIRPCSISELSYVFDMSKFDINNIINDMIQKKQARKIVFKNKEFIAGNSIKTI